MLKPLDRRPAQEPVAVAATGRFIDRRIADTCERETGAISPNVDIARSASEPDLRAEVRAPLDALPVTLLTPEKYG